MLIGHYNSSILDTRSGCTSENVCYNLPITFHPRQYQKRLVSCGLTKRPLQFISNMPQSDINISYIYYFNSMWTIESAPRDIFNLQCFFPSHIRNTSNSTEIFSWALKILMLAYWVI